MGKKDNLCHFVLVICAIILIISGTLYNLKSYEEKKVNFYVEDVSICMNQAETNTIHVIVENCGLNSLTSEENYYLSYHILNENGAMELYDGIRTPIDLHGKSKQNIELVVFAPVAAGNYLLQLNIVQEGVRWFSEEETNKCYIPIQVMENQ